MIYIRSLRYVLFFAMMVICITLCCSCAKQETPTIETVEHVENTEVADSDWASVENPILPTDVDEKSYGSNVEFTESSHIYIYKMHSTFAGKEENVLPVIMGSDWDRLYQRDQSIESYGFFETGGWEDYVSVRWDSNVGYLSMFKIDTIPLDYRNPNEYEEWEKDLPLPSEEEGRYTEDEARIFVMEYLKNNVFMDESLINFELTKSEDRNKIRSRMYGFTGDYYLDGRRFYGNARTGIEGATIEVTCTDEGIRELRGAFLTIVDKERVAHDKLISLETVKGMEEIASRPDIGKVELCYSPVDVDGGEITVHPVWIVYAIFVDGGYPHIAYIVDALSGEVISSDRNFG